VLMAQSRKAAFMRCATAPPAILVTRKDETFPLMGTSARFYVDSAG